MECLDPGFVRGHARDIAEAVNRAREIVGMGEDSFIGDWRSRAALRYLLITIVESAVAIGKHVLRCLGIEYGGYRDVFYRLAEAGVISADTADAMARLASLRNLLVHRYWVVSDVRIYRDARENGLLGVENFVREVVWWLEGRLSRR